MLALSEQEMERSRKNHSVILKSLISVGQVHVAEAIGMHESTLSKMIGEGHLERFSHILAKLGLKVVPQEYKCYDAKSIDALLTLAKERMAQLETPEQLSFED